jgi:hypothetical protein
MLHDVFGPTDYRLLGLASARPALYIYAAHLGIGSLLHSDGVGF